jgi:hypothetical protein
VRLLNALELDLQQRQSEMSQLFNRNFGCVRGIDPIIAQLSCWAAI